MKRPQLQSLNCPACGASLNNNPGANFIKCQYCGNTLVFDDDPEPDVPDEPPVQTPKPPTPPVVIQVPSTMDPLARQRMQQMQNQAVKTAKVAAVLPAIIIFGTLLVGGVVAYLNTKTARQHQKSVQKNVQKAQEEAENRRLTQQKDRENERLKRERESWQKLVEENQTSLPVGFDKLLSESLPENWPTLTKGTSTAPITITWYVTYATTYDKRVFAALKNILRKFESKVRVNIFPLPAHRGRHTQLMEAMLEILEQKGEGAFEELHERFSQDGRSVYTRENWSHLCEIMDCDVKKFNKAMKSRTHASRVSALAPVSRKINLERQVLVRIQNHLFYDSAVVYARIDDVIEGFLNFGEVK